MTQRWIKATYYRGGTSKGVFFQKKDLPTSNQNELNDLFLKVIGSGAYSVVCSAVCRHSGQKVAIKRIANIFSRERDLTKTFLREAMILNHCNHPNVLKLRGLFTQGTDFDQVHFVTNLMDTDLHRVLRSNIILSVNVCITCSIL